MGLVFFIVQTANLFVCVEQYARYDRLDYFLAIGSIFLLDKILSFVILRREAFGYEIFLLDLANLGCISVFLGRYPTFYRPMYGTKLFLIIIPTICVQLLFFFGYDMIDNTQHFED